MMVHLRTITAALLLSATASAQTVQEVPAAAPPTPVAIASEGDLGPPSLPVLDEAMRARVAPLARVVADTTECYTMHGERVDHDADPRCGRWYAQLTRGAEAAAHAVGASLAGNVEMPVRETEGAWQRGPRIVQVMFAASPEVGVPYALHYLARSAREDEFWTTDREILRQLARVTGFDVAPVAPWARDALGDRETQRRVVGAWLRWWREHGAEGLAAWRAAGEQRAVAALTDDDPVVRFSAMQRLATVPAQRAAVTAALHDLLARPTLPAPAVMHLRRWAQRARIPAAAARPPALARRE